MKYVDLLMIVGSVSGVLGIVLVARLGRDKWSDVMPFLLVFVLIVLVNETLDELARNNSGEGNSELEA